MKTVKNRRWAFVLAIAATLAGCAADSELTDGEPNPFDPSVGAPLEINSTLETGMAAAVSRATPATTVPLDAGNIGIFLAGDGYTEQSNINYKATSGVWSANTHSETLLLTALDASVCAYYPYDASKTDKTQVAMTTQEYDENKLFYYASNRMVNGTRAKRTTQFAMTHAYARVQLIISRKNYPTTCNITAIGFNNPALPKTGTLNITNRAYTTTVAGNYVTPIDFFKTLDATSPTYTHDLLVVPQMSDMTAASTVVLTVDNQTMTATIPVDQLTKFEAGKQYEIKIVIQGTGIVPTTVTTTEWEASSVDGDYVPEPGEKPQDPFVTLSDIGLKVAKGNLMRKGGTGKWYLAPDQGYYTGVKDGGDYFCWGIDNPTISGEGGASADALTAGCVAVLGDGWRVPTIDDKEKLINGDNTWGTYISPRGEINGRYFGTKSDPELAYQDDYAFLPAAGYRVVDGRMFSVGSAGYFWSSEPDGPKFAYSFSFNSGYITGPTSSSLRSDGVSVRCVAYL